MNNRGPGWISRYCDSLRDRRPGDLIPVVWFSQTVQTGHGANPRYYSMVKVKQSHYRPGQTQRVPGGRGSQSSRQSANECGRVVSPTHRPPLPPRKYSWYSFLLEAESPPRPQCGRKDCQWKIRIEPATIRLVAQCLNQMRHLVPSPVQWVLGISRGYKGREVGFTTQPIIAPRLKKEYSYNSTPPMGHHGLFQDELRRSLLWMNDHSSWKPHSLHLAWATLETGCPQTVLSQEHGLWC
jgi:hypothetical protein